MVDGKYSFQDLIDIEQLHELFEGFSQATGFATGLCSYPHQELLIGTGWRDICTKFHRAFPASEAQCKKSNLELTSHLKERKALNICHCESGLLHGAAPITIKGVHVASLFTGQVLVKEPDMDFFVRQAQAYGYDVNSYLEALHKVPVVRKEAFRKGLSFLSEMAVMLAERGLTEVRSREKTDALQESKKFLQDVFDGIRDGISVLDRNLTITRVNNWMETMHHEEMPLVGKKCYEVYQKRESICPWCPSVKALSTGNTHVEHVRVPSDAGAFYWCELSAYPLRDENDAVVGVIEHVRDITEREQAEEALRESEQKYRTLFESSTEGFFLMTDVFEDCNEQACRIWACDRKDIIGHSPVEFSPAFQPDGRSSSEAARNYIEAALAGNPQFFYWKHKRKDGKLIDTRNSLKSITVASKPLLLATMGDISDRKRADKEREKLLAQLQQAQKMEAIGTLAGGIAHDFNNILAALIGYTELSLEEAEEGSSLHENLKEILVAGNRAKDLVRQILAFSRQAEHKSSPVKVGLIVKEALKLLRASLPTTIGIHEDIQTDSAVLADPTQLHQVLMNLCANAGQAMEEKGGTLDVSLVDVALDSDFTAQHPGIIPGPYVRLTVSDTGHGMAPDVLGKIFDPYFSTKEPGEGTGLGLSLVHGIVKSCDGTITAHSEPEKGSTFNVYLPVIEREAEAEIGPDEPVPKGTERILFIDDEQVLVNIEKQMLESLGYEVTTKTDGIEALELFKAQPDIFDLVITDMTMPKVTGEDLAAELMRIRPDIPVILCTGFSARINKKRSMAMGIRAFVYKPVLRRDIAKAIRQVLDSRDKKAEHPTARILVIDDDFQVRAMLRQLLEGAGYAVIDAADGKQGIRLFREEPCDVIITDIIMPEKEGIETISELCRDFPEVNIIAISGGGRRPADEYLRLAKQTGAHYALAKPLDQKELLEAVQKLVSAS